jgi:hypothetical protein
MNQSTKRSKFFPLLLSGCGMATIIVAAIASAIYLTVVKNAAEYPTAIFDAEEAIKANADLELVSRDPKKCTITLKHVATGETLEFNAEDIIEGNFSFGGSDREGAKAKVNSGGNAAALDKRHWPAP